MRHHREQICYSHPKTWEAPPDKAENVKLRNNILRDQLTPVEVAGASIWGFCNAEGSWELSSFICAMPA